MISTSCNIFAALQVFWYNQTDKTNGGCCQQFVIRGVQHKNGGMTLIEPAHDVTLEQIREYTEAELSVSEDLTVMRGAI